MTDIGLWSIVGSFIAWELLAHFTGNKTGHTLSNRIWAFEGHSLVRRGGVAAALVALFLHLVLHLF